MRSRSAIAESKRPHTAIEHTGILLWEMDWRVERENILREMVSIAPAADGVLEGEPNCHFQPGRMIFWLISYRSRRLLPSSPLPNCHLQV